MEIKRRRIRISFIACSLIYLFISACTAVAVNQPKTEVLPVEVVTSDKVHFKNVRIINDKGCVVVKGAVKPQKKHGPGIYGHVDIDLIDVEDRTIENIKVSHTPKFLHTKGNKLSYFTSVLGEGAQNSSKVRVSYHYTRNTKKSSCNHNH